MFRYEAVTNAGRTREGLLHADGPRHARQQLRAQGLTPIRLTELPAPQAAARDPGAPLPGDRISGAELARVTRQLAALLCAAIPAEQALATLLEHLERPRTRDIIAQVRAAVLEGQSLHGAMARFPRTFPEVYRALVAAGEESGELGPVLERLAGHLESRQALRGKLVAAFLYPAVLAAVAVIAIILIMVFVVPQMTRVFENAHQDLPLVTRVLVAASEGLRRHGVAITGTAAAIAWMVGFAGRRPEVRRSWDARLLRLPLFGRLVVAAEVARFSSVLAISVGGGVPMLRALDAGASAVGSPTLRRAVEEARRQVQEGMALSRALASQRVFPPLFTQLVASGERTGRLGPMLEHAAAQQRLELEQRTGALASLLEPALILLMGVAVMFIVLAIFLPIIDANSLVR